MLFVCHSYTELPKKRKRSPHPHFCVPASVTLLLRKLSNLFPPILDPALLEKRIRVSFSIKKSVKWYPNHYLSKYFPSGVPDNLAMGNSMFIRYSMVVLNHSNIVFSRVTICNRAKEREKTTNPQQKTSLLLVSKMEVTSILKNIMKYVDWGRVWSKGAWFSLKSISNAKQ